MIITEGSQLFISEGKVLLLEVNHEDAMRYMRYIVAHDKDDIVDVLFRKKNGRIRKCRVHFDDDFVRRAVKGDKSPRILKIRKTNKERDNFVVCELLPSGKYQFRTIPLRKITQIRRNGKRITIDKGFKWEKS